MALTPYYKINWINKYARLKCKMLEPSFYWYIPVIACICIVIPGLLLFKLLLLTVVILLSEVSYLSPEETREYRTDRL